MAGNGSRTRRAAVADKGQTTMTIYDSTKDIVVRHQKRRGLASQTEALDELVRLGAKAFRAAKKV